MSDEAPEAAPAAGPPVGLRRWLKPAVRVVLLVGAVVVLVPVLRSFPQMVTAVRTANPVWFPVALAAVALGQVAAAWSQNACVCDPPPLGRTVRMMIATSFVGTVTPASVGGLALGVRYYRTQGFPTRTATAAVTLQGVVQVATHLVLVAVLGVVLGRNLELATSGQAHVVVLWTLVVLLVAAVVVLAVPPLRAWVAGVIDGQVRPALGEVATLLRSPGRLVLVVSGAALTTIANAAVLWACLEALGQPHRALAAALATMVGGTVASAAPTPGGIGAVEAALVASLSSVGVAASTAVPAVLLYRLLYTWLPFLVGWWQYRSLVREGQV